MWQFNCRAEPTTSQVCVSVSEKEEEDAAPPVWRLHFAAGKTPLSYTHNTQRGKRTTVPKLFLISKALGMHCWRRKTKRAKRYISRRSKIFPRFPCHLEREGKSGPIGLFKYWHSGVTSWKETERPFSSIFPFSFFLGGKTWLRHFPLLRRPLPTLIQPVDNFYPARVFMAHFHPRQFPISRREKSVETSVFSSLSKSAPFSQTARLQKCLLIKGGLPPPHYLPKTVFPGRQRQKPPLFPYPKFPPTSQESEEKIRLATKKKEEGGSLR